MPEPKLPLRLETCLSDLKTSLSTAFKTVRDDYMGYVWGEKQSDLATNLMGNFGCLMANIHSRINPDPDDLLPVSNHYLYENMQDTLKNLNDALTNINQKKQDQPEEKVYENYYIVVKAIKDKIEAAAGKLKSHMESPLETKSPQTKNIIKSNN